MARAAAVCLALVFACGCGDAPAKGRVKGMQPGMVSGIERGVSQPQLEALFGTPARHEFTVQREGAVDRCVCYLFADFHLKYYFCFTNGRLEKIILPPKFEPEPDRRLQRKETPAWRRPDAFARLARVRAAPDLSAQDVADSIEHRYKPGKADPGLTAAFLVAGIITAPVTLARIPGEQAKAREFQSLAQRFDPQRVQTGTLLSDVERMYGSPRVQYPAPDGSEVRYYGPARQGADVVTTDDAFIWVAVVFKHGRACAVFSDDFIDPRRLSAPERSQ